MKTLYAADLDGTLLCPGAVLSPFSRSALNKFTSHGLLITAATARTPATVVDILAGTGELAPAAMMNGVLLFDMAKRKIISAETLSPETRNHILACAGRHKVPSMIYTLSDGALRVFYRDDGTELTRGFVEARNKTTYKTWHTVRSYAEAKNENAIYLAAVGSKEELSALAEDVNKDTSLKTVLYREVNYDNVWVFEAFSASASKAKTIRRSAGLCGADRIVAFGDNYNDLPLFEGADVKVAVENAVPEVIAAADFVCGSNISDGVVRWISGDSGILL